MRPLTVSYDGSIGNTDRKTIGQAAIVIVQPTVSPADNHHRRCDERPHASLFPSNTFHVISGYCLTAVSESVVDVNQYPCIFRYARLTGQQSPRVMNAALSLQHAIVESAGTGRILILTGEILDENTVKWLRGTRISPTLVDSITVLLLLATPTGKRYLMCIYDGPNSDMYERARFNHMTKQKFFSAQCSDIECTIDRHFRFAAKRLRKSGLIDKLWGKKHLTWNIFFSLPADYSYTNAKALSSIADAALTSGIAARQVLQSEFATFYDEMKFKVRELLVPVAYNKVQIRSVRPMEFEPSMRQYVGELEQMIRDHIDNQINSIDASIKRREAEGQSRTQRNIQKADTQNQRLRIFKSLSIDAVAASVNEHIVVYNTEYRRMQKELINSPDLIELISHLDVEHIIDDIAKNRTYNPHMNTLDVPPEADHPPIFDTSISPSGLALYLRGTKEREINVFNTASSDQSVIIEVTCVNNNASSRRAKPIQPIYFLTPAKQIERIKDGLRRSHFRAKIAQWMSHPKSRGRFASELGAIDSVTYTIDASVPSEYFVACILIYVVNSRGHLVVSSERPNDAGARHQRVVQRASHSMLSRGLPVLAAGETVFRKPLQDAAKARGANNYEIIEATNGSGHYRPTTKTLQFVVDKFSAVAPHMMPKDMNTVKKRNAIACGIPILSQMFF